MTTTNHQTREIIRHNIWKVRKEFFYTQQAFSDELGITRCAVGSYEEGRAEPPIYLIVNICRVFDKDLAKFLTVKL